MHLDRASNPEKVEVRADVPAQTPHNVSLRLPVVDPRSLASARNDDVKRPSPKSFQHDRTLPRLRALERLHSLGRRGTTRSLPVLLDLLPGFRRSDFLA